MTIDEVKDFFGTDMAAAHALGISRQAVSAWRRSEEIPVLQQYRYMAITSCELRVDDKVLNNALGLIR